MNNYNYYLFVLFAIQFISADVKMKVERHDFIVIFFSSFMCECESQGRFNEQDVKHYDT